MSSPACLYAPGTWGDCFDLTCGAQGGRCRYVGPPGRNAWRCIAAAPSPSRADFQKDTSMATALDTYKRTVGEQPSCDDAWFAEALDRARAGETEARRQICGSCLRIALTAAERRWNRRSEEDLF